MHEMMSLRHAMLRPIHDPFMHPISWRRYYAMPNIDLYQTANEVVVKASPPGLTADDVQITVTDDVLSLRGEFKQESEQEDATYHLREQRYGAFERSIRLPADVQTDEANAEFKDGILTITLPKAEVAKAKSINIKTK